MLNKKTSLGLLLFSGVLLLVVLPAWGAGDLVEFPANYEEGVLYTTVNRGNIKEDIYTSRNAVAAVKNGQPVPSGTVITLVDYRDGELYRYVVMEKHSGWGSEYPAELRNGEWEYQAFNADRTVNTEENLERCFSCHKSQAGNDFIFTLDDMKTFE